jgi:hypothetical protein
LECIKLKTEASDKWLSSKQDVYKEKENCSKASYKGKKLSMEKTCLKINCQLGFKRSRET